MSLFLATGAAFLGYALSALAARALLLAVLPAGGLWIADLPLVMLAVAGPMHVLVMMAAIQRDGARDIATLQEMVRALRKDLETTRETTIAVREALDRAANAQADERISIDAVAAEVKVLQSLVGELSGRAGSAPGAAMDRPVRPNIAETELLSIVRGGLREGRVDLYVQPVVSLPQRKHRFYECFSRIRDASGHVLGPDRYLAGAEREGLIGAIDNMLLFRCVQLVRRIHRANREIGVFVNISEHSLADKRFFRDFTAFVSDNRELAPYLIFEFAQGHVARHGAAVMLEFERLARRGFRFSMDNVADLDLDVDTLAERQFRFIKVDAQLLLHATRDAQPRLDLRRLKAALDRNRIDLIVERIEDEATLRELLDYPLDFGQGYLFGEPRLAKLAD
jgi:cyclic-di-GMP phosphodiesterase TipF (flagellum assembly factor)